MNKSRILIVDDNAHILKTLADVLQNKGYITATANKGSTALEMAAEVKPTVALIDLKLKDMAGLKVMEALKGLSPGTMCIILTGHASQTTAIDAVNLGAYGYILKPYDMDQLLVTIRQAIEKKETEEALRRSEALLRAIIDHSPALISVEDPEGRFTLTNRNYERLAGPAPHKYIGKTLYELFPDDAVDNLYTNDLAPLMAEGPVESETILPHKDGSHHTYWTVRFPLHDQGEEITGIGTICTDITERKRLEQQLFQSQKLEAIGTLAGGIAHDFNNILMAILGYAEILSMKLPPQSSERPYLDQITRAGNRAKDLVRQILTFSRERCNDLVAINLKSVIKEALKLLRSTIPTTIDIVENISSNGIVMADAIQIHQVIMNLCTNAYHAMQDRGGLMGVSLLDIDLDSDRAAVHSDLKPGPHVRLMVSDTGTGMDSATLARIFEPFFTTKGKDRGTGMGLSVVHGIVKNHGGVIEVQSEPLKGTTFQVFLPRIDVEIHTEKETPLPISMGSERILFVDDEQNIASMAEKMLELLGYQVEAVTSSMQALEKFTSSPELYDLVISDLTMPGLTGDLLAQELLLIKPELPVILCSGYNDRISAQKIADIGVRQLLTKPLSLQEIAAAIRRVLEPKGEAS